MSLVWLAALIMAIGIAVSNYWIITFAALLVWFPGGRRRWAASERLVIGAFVVAEVVLAPIGGAARAAFAAGFRPGDVVLNSWLYGTHNGAWVFDEALYRWLNCVVVTASAGEAAPAKARALEASRPRRL